MTPCKLYAYRQFINNTPAKLWYFVKCIYFCLSAWQIRSGYPTRVLGNMLTKKYNYLNMMLFKGYALPKAPPPMTSSY